MTPAELATILQMLQDRGVGGENVRHFVPQAERMSPWADVNPSFQPLPPVASPFPTTRKPAGTEPISGQLWRSGPAPPEAPPRPQASGPDYLQQLVQRAKELKWGPRAAPSSAPAMSTPTAQAPPAAPPVVPPQMRASPLTIAPPAPESTQKPTPAPTPKIDKGSGQSPTIDEQLKDARRKRSGEEAIGRIGSDLTSKEEILLGLGRKPYVAEDARSDVSLLEGLRAQERQTTLQREMDPWEDKDSTESQFARSLLQEAGYKVPENTTGSAIRKMVPLVQQIVDQQIAGATAQASAAEDADKAKKERQTFMAGQWNKFTADTQVKELQTAVREAEKIEQLIEQNPMGQKATLVMMAKAAGDSGRLSDQDIQRWSQRPGLMGSYDKIVGWLQSEMTEGHKEDMIDLARMLKQKNLEEYRKVAKQRAKKLSGIRDDIPQAEWENLFLDDPVVRVRRKADGKTGTMSLREAQAEPDVYEVFE